MKKDISNNIKNKKGFTLVEVIVAIAVLGIIAIAMLPIFSTSIKSISRSGQRTNNIRELQDDMVDNMRKHEKPKVGKEATKAEINPTPTIVIKDLTDTPIEVKGDMLEVKKWYEKDKIIKIQTFIPSGVK